MSEFACPVVRVKIEPHPNADAIEIARVGDYQSIVKKGQFKDGGLAVYIPEQSLLPEWMLKELGFWDEVKGKGSLSGSLGNRVKAIKLRGIVSQGLLYPTHPATTSEYAAQVVAKTENTYRLQQVNEGADVAEVLGVEKFTPVIPAHMAGRIVGVDLAATHKYDFENIKKHPELFEDGETVVITEKLHGTLLQIGVVPPSMANERYYKGRVIITSKGQGAKGYILDHNDDTNLYVQAAKKHDLFEKMLEYVDGFSEPSDKPHFLVGEVIGRTSGGAAVQQGYDYGQEDLQFRAFDLCYGARETAEYGSYDYFVQITDLYGIPRVPELYVGPYSKQILLEHTDGKTTLAEDRHIREGVVVKHTHEKRHPRYGRKIAKSISDAYLLKSTGEELQ